MNSTGSRQPAWAKRKHGLVAGRLEVEGHRRVRPTRPGRRHATPDDLRVGRGRRLRRSRSAASGPRRGSRDGRREPDRPDRRSSTRRRALDRRERLVDAGAGAEMPRRCRMSTMGVSLRFGATGERSPNRQPIGCLKNRQPLAACQGPARVRRVGPSLEAQRPAIAAHGGPHPHRVLADLEPDPHRSRGGRGRWTPPG